MTLLNKACTLLLFVAALVQPITAQQISIAQPTTDVITSLSTEEICRPVSSSVQWTASSTAAWLAVTSTPSSVCYHINRLLVPNGGNAIIQLKKISLPQPTSLVVVDTSIRYQQMVGWEATAQAGQESANFGTYRDTLFSLAANDLGINRIRLELRSGSENSVDTYTQWRAGQLTTAQYRTVRFAPVNDNANPAVKNASGFHFSHIDTAVTTVINPMRQKLLARGERLYVNLNYVSFTGPTLHTTNPEEYAEIVLAAFQHLESRYGWVPDAVEAILEPDHTPQWTATQIGAAIAAAGARLAAAGYTPEFIAPSVLSTANAVPFLDGIVAVPGARTYLREVSYHRYSGVSDAALIGIRNRATALGLRTSMLEHIGSGVEALYKDLTLANVSAWQQYTIAFPTTDDGAQYYLLPNGVPTMGSRTPALRQYFKYVKRGSFRVAATSNVESVRPVAFTGDVVVLHTSGAGLIGIRGLAAGRYNISAAPSSIVSSSTASVDVDGTLRIQVTGSGVITASKEN